MPACACAIGDSPDDAGLEGLLRELIRGPAVSGAVPVRSDGRVRVVDLADVDWIGAADNYVSLHCGNREYLVRDTIARFEQRLDPPSSSAFIARPSSASIASRARARWSMATSKCGSRTAPMLTMSRTFRSRIEQRFGRRLWSGEVLGWRAMRITASLLVVIAVLGAGSIITAQNAPDLTKINPKFLMTVEDAQKLHAAKDAQGPALSGNTSWRNFVGIIETRMRAANAVGFMKNAWTFNRWSTTEFPDTSGWSLSSDGKPIKVASYGANSGTTLPPASPRIWCSSISASPAQRHRSRRPTSLERSSSFKPCLRRRRRRPPSASTNTPATTCTLSNPETFPEPRAPTKVTRTVTMRAEMRQHSQQIPRLIEGKAAGAVFVFDASYDRLAGLYTFGVPANHQMPTLYVDRIAGRPLSPTPRRESAPT